MNMKDKFTRIEEDEIPIRMRSDLGWKPHYVSKNSILQPTLNKRQLRNLLIKNRFLFTLINGNTCLPLVQNKYGGLEYDIHLYRRKEALSINGGVSSGEIYFYSIPGDKEKSEKSRVINSAIGAKINETLIQKLEEKGLKITPSTFSGYLVDGVGDLEPSGTSLRYHREMQEVTPKTLEKELERVGKVISIGWKNIKDFLGRVDYKREERVRHEVKLR